MLGKRAGKKFQCLEINGLRSGVCPRCSFFSSSSFPFVQFPVEAETEAEAEADED
jgi:hypothetical protein